MQLFHIFSVQEQVRNSAGTKQDCNMFEIRKMYNNLEHLARKYQVNCN